MNQSLNGQQIYISPDGWFSLVVPEKWEYEEERDCTTFWRGDDGIGALQISAYESAAPRSAKKNLIEYLAGEDLDVQLADWTLSNGQQVAMTQFTSGESFTKALFVTKGKYVLFITYICDLASEAVEASEVETIIDSIRLAE